MQDSPDSDTHFSSGNVAYTSQGCKAQRVAESKIIWSSHGKGHGAGRLGLGERREECSIYRALGGVGSAVGSFFISVTALLPPSMKF